jgi:hypothetical protein
MATIPTLAVFGIALVLLLLAGRYVEAREGTTKVPCANGGQMIYAGATACPHCQAPIKEPRAVGLLGGTQARPVDPASHPDRLIAVTRCPVWATRLGRRAVRPMCEACGYTVRDDPRFAQEDIAFRAWSRCSG